MFQPLSILLAGDATEDRKGNLLLQSEDELGVAPAARLNDQPSTGDCYYSLSEAAQSFAVW